MPLALHLTVGQSEHLELDQVIANLQEARYPGPDQAFYMFLFKQAWRELSKEAQGLLVYMSIATRVPQTTTLLLGIKPADDILMDEQTLSRSLTELSRWNILEQAELEQPNQRISYDIHPLTRFFLNNPDMRKHWEVRFSEVQQFQESTKKYEGIFQKWPKRNR